MLLLAEPTDTAPSANPAVYNILTIGELIQEKVDTEYQSTWQKWLPEKPRQETLGIITS